MIRPVLFSDTERVVEIVLAAGPCSNVWCIPYFSISTDAVGKRLWDGPVSQMVLDGGPEGLLGLVQLSQVHRAGSCASLDFVFRQGVGEPEMARLTSAVSRSLADLEVDRVIVEVPSSFASQVQDFLPDASVVGRIENYGRLLGERYALEMFEWSRAS